MGILTVRKNVMLLRELGFKAILTLQYVKMPC